MTHGAARGLLVSSYVFGAVMIGRDVLPGFVYLTAPHLVFSLGLLLWGHERAGGRGRLWAWGAVCFALGFWAEFVGVHYGWLFGDYVYGDVLGPKLWGIPLVIGVNWMLVVYAVCSSLDAVAGRWPVAPRAVVAAAALVLLDVLIEPVAIELDYWTWAAGAPPTQNYVGWFGVGLIQTTLYYLLLGGTRNRLAPWLLALQVIFFWYLSP